MNLNTVLTAMKGDLASILGIKSVAIGIEPQISPASYPAIRIVPLEEKPENLHRKRVTVDVYLGYATKPQAIEEAYTTLYGWASEVIIALEQGAGYAAIWQGTTNDGDQLPAAKMLCVSFEVVY